MLATVWVLPTLTILFDVSAIKTFSPDFALTEKADVLSSFCGRIWIWSSLKDTHESVPSPSWILDLEVEIPFVSSATFNKLLYVFAGDLFA